MKLLHSEILNDWHCCREIIERNPLTVEIDEKNKLIVFARLASYILNADLTAFKACFEAGFKFLYENSEYSWCNELTELKIMELEPVLFLHETVNNFFIKNLEKVTNCYFIMPTDKLAHCGIKIYLNFPKPDKTEYQCFKSYNDLLEALNKTKL